MRFDTYKILVRQIGEESFTKQQVLELYKTVAESVCRMTQPELKTVQHVISKACDDLDDALEAVNERDARFDGPDEMDLARDRRAAEEPV